MNDADRTGVAESTLRVLVVDDVPLARRRVVRMASELPRVQIVAEAGDFPSALAVLREQPVDLVLLDIELPGADGFMLVEALRSISPAPVVVLVTAYDQYAVQAFDVCAVDYVLKPVEASRLSKAIERAQTVLSTRSAASSDALLCLREGNITHRLSCASIDWIEAAGNYLCVRSQGQTLVVRGTLNELQSRLDPKQFLRVHRSRIVNAARVCTVIGNASGDAQLAFPDGSLLLASRTHRSAIAHLKRST